jgi:hypothetical protein
LVTALCAGTALVHADESVSIGPQPDWVVPLTFQRLAAAHTTNGGAQTDLLLRDVQVNQKTGENFQHEARQLLTGQGVQSGSQLSIEFDPTCQSLVLHWVKLWRGTNSFNRLDLDRVKVIQPESSLDDYLFTGRKTALLLLDDVRPGDIIDYGCTIRGNFLLGGKLSGSIFAQEYEPAERLVTRLVWPSDRHLHILDHGTAVKPLVVKKDGSVEYTWDFRHVPAVRPEAPLPVWFRPLASVQWTEFTNWAEVNQWALTLFTNSVPISPDLKHQIAEWQRLPGPEERLLAVLRFVQDEVRYQGIEAGAGAYTPSDPSTVFARRFGDCKDKTMLCVSVLRALKIEAYPVLVATDLRQTVANYEPSPVLFDHAIVRATVGGASYWLDPTATSQRGSLAARGWAEYGRGLVIRPGTFDLAVIPESPVKPKTTVLEYVLVRPAGQSSDLKIVTVADGPDADRWRRRFATSERADIAADNLNRFAALYPGIVRVAPMEYEDDEKENEVVVTEFYQVDRFVNQLPDAPQLAARFYSYNLDRVLRKPAVSMRSMPLGLEYPVHQDFRAEITLPAAVPVTTGDWVVDNPAFRFRKTAIVSGGKLLLQEEYAALGDHVPVEAMPDYLRQLDQVVDLLDYVIVSF